jgi:hypothetical protein
MNKKLKFCIKYGCILVMVLCLMVSGMALWVKISPPGLGFMYAYIRDVMTRFEPEYRIEFKEIRLKWTGKGLMPGISVTDITCFSENNELLGRCPSMMIGFSLWGILSGHLEPVEIGLMGVEIFPDRFNPPVEGEDHPSPPSSAHGGSEEPVRNLYDIVTQVSNISETCSYFEGVYIQGLSIGIQQDAAIPGLKFSEVSLRKRSDGAAVVFHLSMSCSRDDQKVLGVDAVITHAPEKTDFQVHVEDMYLSTLGQTLPDLAFLSGMNFPLNGFARAECTPEGRFEVTEFNLNGLQGTVFHDQVWKEPLPLKRLQVKGRIADNLSRLDMASFLLEFEGPSFSGAGYVTQSGSVNLDICVQGLKLQEAGRYWPLSAAPAAREWITGHFTAGDIQDSQVRLRFQPGDFESKMLPQNAVEAVVPFQGVNLDYYPPLPMLRHAEGQARFTAHDVDITATGGQAAHSSVQRGRVYISGLADPVSYIDIQADLHGPADDLRQAVDLLTHNQSFPIRVSSGEADTHLSFNFPLDDFTTDAFAYGAVSHIRNIHFPDLQGFDIFFENIFARLEREDLFVEGSAGKISHKELLESPIAVLNMQANARIAYDPPGLDLNALMLDLGEPLIRAAGYMKGGSNSLDMDLDVRVDKLHLNRAFLYWPPAIAAPARKWVKDHILFGEVNGAAIHMKVKGGKDGRPRFSWDDFTAAAPFKNTTVDGYPPLPLLENAGGSALFSGKAIEITIDQGKVRQSVLEKGSVRFADLDKNNPTVFIEASFQGPLSDVMAVKARLEGNDKSMNIGGAAATRFTLSIPLESETGSRDVKFSAASDITGLEIQNFQGLKISDGHFKAGIEDKKFNAEGRVKVGRTQINLKADHFKMTPAGIEGEVELGADVNAADLGDFKLSPLPFLTGKAGVHSRVTLFPDTIRIQTRMDLKHTEIALEPLGLTKVQGEAADLNIQAVRHKDGRITFSDIRLSGKGISCTGSGWIALDIPPLFEFNFNPFQWGRNDMGIGLKRAETGYDIQLTGKAFDAAPLVRFLKTPKKARVRDPKKFQVETAPPGSRVRGGIAANLEQILMMNGQILTGVTAGVTWDSSGITGGDVKGHFKEGGLLDAGYNSLQGKYILNVQSDDSGKMIDSLGLDFNTRGGDLRIYAECAGPLSMENPVTGRIELKKFVLVNAPEVVTILSMASFVGILENMRSGGIDFNLLEVDLTYENNMLLLKNGRMEGLSLGMTGEGTYDLTGGEMDFKGLVVPFNLVNQAIGTIPILGKLVVGDGIIAVQYTLRGPKDAPKAAIQPLSTLSIGSLRNIFKMLPNSNKN